MLQILGVELCGEPLDWDDVRPFLKRFEECDVSNTGRITREDLDHIYEADCVSHDQLLEQMHGAWSEAAIVRAEEYEHERESRLSHRRQSYHTMKRLVSSVSHVDLADFSARGRVSKWKAVGMVVKASTRLEDKGERARVPSISEEE